MIVGVLADTHVPKRARDLPLQAYQHLARVDAIIHAGDVVSQAMLDRLETIAPVFAVLGNNDHSMVLPAQLTLCWEDVPLAVVHNSGAREGRAARMRRWFPSARVVVFGHSHVPVNNCDAGLLLFNPGSPTDRRRQPFHTMGLLQLSHGSVQAEIVRLD
jgi:uncharacterized protein